MGSTNPSPIPYGIQSVQNSTEVFERNDITIRRGDTEIAVADTLENLMLKLEVMSEIMDDIIENTGYSGMSIEDRVNAKLMLKKLSG
jgi:hypothetical protein